MTGREVRTPTEGMGIAVDGPLLVVLFRRTPTAKTLKYRIPFIKKAIAKSRGLIAVVIVIDSEAQGELPDAESRAETKRQMEEFHESVACVATVLEGGSLKFLLLRTLLRAVAVAANTGYKNGFFANVEQAERWCREHMNNADPEGTTLNVRAAADELRAITSF